MPSVRLLSQTKKSIVAGSRSYYNYYQYSFSAPPAASREDSLISLLIRKVYIVHSGGGNLRHILHTVKEGRPFLQLLIPFGCGGSGGDDGMWFAYLNSPLLSFPFSFNFFITAGKRWLVLQNRGGKQLWSFLEQCSFSSANLRRGRRRRTCCRSRFST